MFVTKEIIISKANELGFELVGFAKPEILEKEGNYYKVWLDKNFNAGMEYMKESYETRTNPFNFFNLTKTIISLGISYYVDDDFQLEQNEGKISRYAWGKDYHFVLKNKINELLEFLTKIEPSIEARINVDSGPALDKTWAAKSGIGWQGKNTNIINKDIGSYFFIATIFINKEFENDLPIQDFCGSCSACLDACPTEAFPEPYVLDSNKCISYLTIENKKEISQEFSGKFDNWLFGCDICQEVCPWNKKFSKKTDELNFKTDLLKKMKLDTLFSFTNRQFQKKYSNSPILRARLKGIKRNAEFLLKQESNKKG